MYSFAMFGWFRGFIEGGSWVWLWLLFFGALLNAIREHRKLWDEVQDASGTPKSKALRKIAFDWSLVILSLIGALASEWSSETSATKIAEINERAGNAYKLAGQANERESSNEIRRAELEIELNKTRADLLKLEPRNQQLVSLTASVWIHTPEDLEFIKPNIVTAVGGVAELVIRFGTNRPREITLYSYKFTQWRGGITDFKLGFELDKDMPSPSMEIPNGMTASDLEKCDLVELRARFLPSGVLIGTGTVAIAINSVIKKEFAIVAQKSGGTSKPQPGDPQGTEQIEWMRNSIWAWPTSPTK